MADSEVEICKLALGNIGDTSVVTSISPPDANKAARGCALYYAPTRDLLLSQVDFNFSRHTTDLELVTGASIPNWDYVYRYPNDCHHIWRIVNEAVDLETDETKIPYEVFSDEENSGKLIATNQPDAILRYSRKITDVTLFSPLFVECLQWSLASKLAVYLKADPKLSAYASQQARGWLNEAGTQSLREGYKGPRPQSEFVTGRY